jgi:hypothetical protein
MEQQSDYGINHIGAYLDNGIIDTTHDPGGIQNTHVPQIVENTIINDTLHWFKVEGSFTANGNEKFITIGNFFDKAHTSYDTSITYWQTSFSGFSWYLVDDVSVIESDAKAYAGHDTIVAVGDSVFLGEIAVPYVWYDQHGNIIDSIHGGVWVKPSLGSNKYKVKLTLCGATTWDSVLVNAWPLDVQHLNNGGNVRVLPNPFTDELHLDNLDSAVITLYDVFGRKVYSEQQSPGKTTINTKHLSKGMYFIEITDTTGNRIVQKIIKQ